MKIVIDIEQNDIAFELACLYYEVHNRFYDMDTVDYVKAMSEIAVLAHMLGYTLNDLAKIVVCKQ